MNNYYLLSTWERVLAAEFERNGEKYEDASFAVENQDYAKLKKEVDFGFGGDARLSFTIWGKDWVYFPVCYDGSHSVGSVPRNPVDKPCGPFGGGE